MSVIYLALNIIMAVFTVYGMYCFIHDDIFKVKFKKDR